MLLESKIQFVWIRDSQVPVPGLLKPVLQILEGALKMPFGALNMPTQDLGCKQCSNPFYSHQFLYSKGG